MAPYYLAKYLSRKFEIDVLTYNLHNYKSEERINGINISRIDPIILKFFNPEPFSFKLIFDFYKKIKKVEIIHLFNFYHFFTLLPLIFICKITHKPFVFSISTFFETIEFLKNKKRGIFLPFLFFILRKTVKNLIVSTRRHVKILKKMGFKNNKIFVLPCGAEIKNYNFSISKKDRYLLLNVARFDWNKGHEILLKVMKNVIKRIPKAKLVIVGHVSKENILKKTQKLIKLLKLEKCVKIFTDISQEKLKSLYESASIFLFPSTIEDFGIVNIEAMAAGLPVVAFRVGGIPSVIKHKKTGFLVSPNDVETFSKNVILLLRNEKLRRRLSINCKKYAKKFDWKNLSQKLIGIYTHIIKNN